jgi:hypothetical protein
MSRNRIFMPFPRNAFPKKGPVENTNCSSSITPAGSILSRLFRKNHLKNTNRGLIASFFKE